MQQLVFYSGIGSTEDYWKRQDAAQVMAQVGGASNNLFHYFFHQYLEFPCIEIILLLN